MSTEIIKGGLASKSDDFPSILPFWDYRIFEKYILFPITLKQMSVIWRKKKCVCKYIWFHNIPYFCSLLKKHSYPKFTLCLFYSVFHNLGIKEYWFGRNYLCIIVIALILFCCCFILCFNHFFVNWSARYYFQFNITSGLTNDFRF